MQSIAKRISDREGPNLPIERTETANGAVPAAHLQHVSGALLLFTGLYLFVLPYATKWRSGRDAD